MQDCDRFLLNHVNQDTSRPDGMMCDEKVLRGRQRLTLLCDRTGPSLVTQLFGTTTLAWSSCQECAHESVRKADTLLFDLAYPTEEQSRSSHPSFPDLLRGGMLKETHSKAWCEKCQNYKVGRHPH